MVVSHGKSLKSLRRGVSRGGDENSGPSSGSTRKFKRGSSGSKAKAQTLKVSTPGDDHEEGNFDKSGRDTPKSPKIGSPKAVSPKTGSPKRKFTRARSAAPAKEKDSFDVSSILRTSTESKGDDSPRLLGRPISSDHPNSFRNASKFKEEREKREAARRVKSPRDMLRGGRSKKGEEEKKSKDDDNDDDSAHDDHDHDDHDDEDGVPRRLGASPSPKKVNKNPALNLNLSSVTGAEEETKGEAKGVEGDKEEEEEEEEEENSAETRSKVILSSMRKANIPRQRSSLMHITPSNSKKFMEDIAKANPKQPINRRASSGNMNLGGGLKRRGSIVAGVMSISTDFDDDENSSLAFGTEVLTPKVAVPKMFESQGSGKQGRESPGLHMMQRRGSFLGLHFGSIGSSFDAQEGNEEHRHHRKRSLIKIGTHKIIDNLVHHRPPSPEERNEGSPQHHSKRSLLKMGKEKILEKMGVSHKDVDADGKQNKGAKEISRRERSKRERSGRERHKSKDGSESPKGSAKVPKPSFKKKRELRRGSLKDRKRVSTGFKDEVEVIDHPGGDTISDDESHGSESEGSSDESWGSSDEDETSEEEEVIVDNEYWSHKAKKLHGGDKGRVRNTVRLDPYNIKRALDADTWETIRYMEGVVVESGNGNIYGYYSCIICEDRIIFLPLAGVKFTEVVFREFGVSGHIIMVPAHEIMSCGYMRGVENTGKLWENQDMNQRSLHIKLNLQSGVFRSDRKKSTRLSGQMHIYTYENNSKVMYHICRMWIDCFTRMKARIPLVKEQSEVALASAFIDEVEGILHENKGNYQDHIHAMSYLASELINDITLKQQFFQRTNVFLFAFHCIKEFENDMTKEKGSKSKCLLVLRRLVVCFKLVFAALFNSTSASSRYQFFFLGDTMLQHVAWYAKDFHAFIQAFVAATGFTPAKLTIGDVNKLTKIRTQRKTIGRPKRKPGLMTRETMNVVLDLDELRAEIAEEEFGKKMAVIEKEEKKKRKSKRNSRKSRRESTHSPRTSISPNRSPRTISEENSPRSPRSLEENREMFHVLSDALMDYQVAVLVQLQDMVTNYNLECHTLQGRFVHERRETIAQKVKQAHEGFAEIEFNISTFFDGIFQRMITLIDDVKSTKGDFRVTQNLLDKLEKLNFSTSNYSPRGYKTMEEISIAEGTNGLHKMNQPTIAMYNYAKLLYNIVNDDIFTREEAKLSGEEEIKNFIGNKENLSFFRRSGDVHLNLAVSFIKKTKNWMGIESGDDIDNLEVVEGGMFDRDDEFDIE
mmetsp:Transcript_9551/g.19422  ORF Transcript_9551/g.19422 Transcript_9551/m.19422 type:complete len:1273 (+) Transcript_9551:135-3953(+)|eukprot:CAMPEP_0118666530 /NCGR_PEP_ID=MMETSP0785-20121206/19266_1 /TAXON_ID=91992 /ORGANISM="Bolidomonas pacifica, Strain CCMP 1866" /LENGTH=1272 /DNA_ID=CAMNT_0006560851 /DNA_START=91 /DNA_END=3909 /DNA_ORIENTATION=+